MSIFIFSFLLLAESSISINFYAFYAESQGSVSKDLCMAEFILVGGRSTSAEAKNVRTFWVANFNVQKLSIPSAEIFFCDKWIKNVHESFFETYMIFTWVTTCKEISLQALGSRSSRLLAVCIPKLAGPYQFWEGTSKEVRQQPRTGVN